MHKHQKHTFKIERINTNKSLFRQSLTRPKYSRNKKSAGEHFSPSNFKQSTSTSTFPPSRACYHNWSPTLLKRKDRRNSVPKIRHTEGTEGILAVKLFSIKDETWLPFPSCHPLSLSKSLCHFTSVNNT